MKWQAAKQSKNQQTQIESWWENVMKWNDGRYSWMPIMRFAICAFSCKCNLQCQNMQWNCAARTSTRENRSFFIFFGRFSLRFLIRCIAIEWEAGKHTVQRIERTAHTEAHELYNQNVCENRNAQAKIERYKQYHYRNTKHTEHK